MTNIETISLCIVISTCLKEFLNMKKVWWGPIYSLFNEFLWVGFFLLVPGSRIILIACGVYILNYAFAVPKWRRERTQCSHRDAE